MLPARPRRGRTENFFRTGLLRCCWLLRRICALIGVERLYVLPELLDPRKAPAPDDLPPPALASAAVSRITHERKNAAIPRTRTRIFFSILCSFFTYPFIVKDNDRRISYHHLSSQNSVCYTPGT